MNKRTSGWKYLPVSELTYVLYQLYLGQLFGCYSKQADSGSRKASPHSESLGSLIGLLQYFMKAKECIEELMSFQHLGLCSMVAKQTTNTLMITTSTLFWHQYYMTIKAKRQFSNPNEDFKKRRKANNLPSQSLTANFSDS